MRCGFWPLIHSYEYPCSSQSFPGDQTAGVSSKSFTVKNKSNSLTNCGLFIRIGLLDVVTVSNSAEFESFLLIMCIDAPESTTNSLSSGLIVDGEGRHQFSEGEKNVVLCFSFSFRIHLAIFHAASRAYRSCLSVSSWDRSSNVGALGLRWWGSPGKSLHAMFFGLEGWRDATRRCVNWTHRIGFSKFELLRKIDEDFDGSTSWNTQPNCRVIFNMATALLSPFYLNFCWAVHQPGGVQ